jgi:spermidine synthase
VGFYHKFDGKQEMKRVRLYGLFTLLGFAAIVAQVTLHRRAIVVFGGNELTVGVIFAAWMLWAGLGNFVMGRFADRLKNVPLMLALFVFLISVFLPFTVFAFSLVKAILGVPPPQMTGPGINLAATLVLLFPLCFSIGASMVLSAKTLATGGAHDIGRFYIFDSLGSAAGGLLFSWFAIQYLTPLEASFLAAAVLIAGCGIFLETKMQQKLSAAFLALIFVLFFFVSGSIEKWSDKIQWKNYNAVVDLDSRFGNIIVTENRGEHTLFFDGMPQFSTPLPDTYETDAVLPILFVNRPKDILLIGGGLSGMLNQWRDIDLKSISYVQIDPLITAVEKKVMAPAEMFFDPRLKTHFTDGRGFLRRKNIDGCESGCFDVIIVLAGDPTTAAANRYYTEEFFRDAKRKLRGDGVIFFGVFEPTNYLSAEVKNLLGTVYATLGRVFEHIIVLPLDNYYFAASAGTGSLTDDLEVLRSRIDERGWHAPALSSQVLYGIFPERIEDVRDAVSEAAVNAKTLNLDKYPVAYYAGLILWAERSGEEAAGFLKLLTKARLWHGLVFMTAVLLFSFLGKKKYAVQISSAWALAAVGFASIVYEIVLLIWYQVKVGLLFYRLGIIITAFMVGLSAGAYAAIRFRSKRPEVGSQRLVAPLLAAFAIYMPLLFVVSALSFPLANFLCGVISGLIYQFTANMLVEKKRMIGASAGIINFSDYAGAAAGSVLAAVIMVPLFGLAASLFSGSILLAIAAFYNFYVVLNAGRSI